jgi:hypothetical protein
MDTSVKQTNRPPGEFTKFIINKLRDSKQALSASTLCMAVKDKLPSQFHPNKGEFNKWMKTLYNIETDNSNPDMPYYKFKITDFEIFDKYKIGDNSYVKILLDKVKNDYTRWSEIYRMYNTTQYNQITWNNLNSIYNSSCQNVKTFDEKFPEYSKTIDRFRIYKMPNKPTFTLNKENVQKVQPKEINYKESLKLEPASSQSQWQRLQYQETTQSSPNLLPPPPGLPHPPGLSHPPGLPHPPPGLQRSNDFHHKTPIAQQQYQTPIAQQQYQSYPVQLEQKYEIPPPPPLSFKYDTVQNKPLTIDGGFESLLGLNLYPINNLNEIINQLSHSDLIFLDKVQYALKNTEGSALFRLIKEIGKVRNIAFS